MRYILAATEDRAATEVIRAAFRRPFQVDVAATVRDCLESLRKRRYEFTFIDLDLLKLFFRDLDRVAFEEDIKDRALLR